MRVRLPTSLVVFAAALLAFPSAVLTSETQDRASPGSLLLSEILQAFGGELRSLDAEQRFAEVRETLRPTFAALPKNSQGRVGDAAARHALHRFFVQQHGWVVSGVEPKGGRSQSPLASRILVEKAPEAVRSTFERSVSSSAGFGLEEIAVLAVTVEHLVHADALQKLEDTYRAKQVLLNSTISKSQAADLIELYMASFLRGRNISTWSADQAKRLQENIFHLYPGWAQTRKLVREIQDKQSPSSGQFGFAEVARVALELGDRFVSWNEDQCRSVKDQLVVKDTQRAGRAPLKEFYAAAFHKKRYQFTDTESTLRRLHLLDETNRKAPSVIIPNYMVGQSNCVAKTNHYSMCCPHECEGIIVHLERSLGSNEASPEQIEEAMASVPSTVKGIPPTSDAKHSTALGELAKKTGGRIHLYGPPFAKWLHEAYPHECVFPHWSVMELNLVATTADEKEAIRI